MPFGLTNVNPLKYLGRKIAAVPTVEGPRRPTVNDRNYPIQCLWRVEKNPQTGTEGEEWILVKFETNGDATWQQLALTAAGSNLDTLTGDSGPVISPDGAGNIDLVGEAAQGVSSTGSGNQIEFTVADATDVQKGVASFSNTDFTVTAGHVELASSSIVLQLEGDNAAQASPTAGIIKVLGGTGGIQTSAAGDTLTLNGPLTYVGAFTEVTSATVALVGGNGYILNRDLGVTATLPATCNIGDVIRVLIKNTTTPENHSIAQNAGQTIHFGTSDTTTGVGGSLAPTQGYDALALVCITANTDFMVISSIGNWTVV